MGGKGRRDKYTIAMLTQRSREISLMGWKSMSKSAARPSEPMIELIGTT